MTLPLAADPSPCDFMVLATLDPTGRITAWYPLGSRLLGHRADDLAGQFVWDVLPMVPPEMRRAARRCLPWSGDVILCCIDGSDAELRCELRPSRDLHGRRGCMLLAAVGEQLAREGGAPRAADLVEETFVQVPLAIAVYDHEGRLARCNAALSRLADRSEEEMRGQLLSELLPAPPLDAVAALGAEVLRTGEAARARSLLPLPGEREPRLWTSLLTPLTGADGRIEGLASVVIDTTREYLAGQRLSLATEAAARIGTTLDAVRTMQELAEFAQGRLADQVTVDLLSSVFSEIEEHSGAAMPGGLCRVAQCGVAPGARCTGGIPGLPPWAAQLWDSRQAGRVVAADDRGPEHAVAHAEGSAGGQDGERTVCALALPLLAYGQRLGTVRFVREGRGFDGDETLLLEDIVARAAISLDNARRYTRERSAAVSLQRSLLPQVPVGQHAVDVGFRYLPAESVAGVGGDWFDVIPLSGARVALVVGDVVGHGVHASATMGRLRTAVRTLADLDLPPEELLARLDDMVVREEGDWAVSGRYPAEMCATCAYAVYDPVTGWCSVACAGHPAPAVVTPGGGARFLGVEPGPPLGVGGLPFEACTVRLPENSLLAFYSDGLVEDGDRDVVRNGEILLHALSGGAGGEDLEHTCDRVVGALTSARPRDDVTLLLTRTRVLPQERVSERELSVDPAAVRDARRWVRERLELWGLGELAFTTELVVSELVTNAIRHAAAPVSVRLIHDMSLICEVSDARGTAPRLRRARLFEEGGRGLLLVAQLTQRWGTRFTSEGKTIWAEQRLSG